MDEYIALYEDSLEMFESEIQDDDYFQDIHEIKILLDWIQNEMPRKINDFRERLKQGETIYLDEVVYSFE